MADETTPELNPSEQNKIELMELYKKQNSDGKNWTPADAKRMHELESMEQERNRITGTGGVAIGYIPDYKRLRIR